MLWAFVGVFMRQRCEVFAFIDNEPALGSSEGDRFEVLVTLVEAYEAKHSP